MPVRGAAIGIELDVTDHQAVEAMVAQVVLQWGRVDVLVANAGGGPRPASRHQSQYARSSVAASRHGDEPVRDRLHLQRHCQVNELSPPSCSLCPEFGAREPARVTFSDPEPSATDPCSMPWTLNLTMPCAVIGEIWSPQPLAFDRYRESYPKRNRSPRSCNLRAGDERSAVPACV